MEQRIDLIATAKAISEELLNDPSLKLYKDDRNKIEIPIVNLDEDEKQVNHLILTHIEKNKKLPATRRQPIYVYNGFGDDRKLVKTKDIQLLKTQQVLKANDITVLTKET